MGDPIITMPEVTGLLVNNFSFKHWLQYYKNVWTRNLAARCIDVETDKALKAINPNEMVLADDQRPITVRERLEARKILVADALSLLAGIEKLLALTDDQIQEQVLSEKALEVAEDAKPEPKAGDVVEQDGKKGTLQSDGKGGLTFVADAEPAAKTEPTEAGI